MTKRATSDALLAARDKVAFLNDSLRAIQTAKHRISPEGREGLRLIMREILELLAQGQEAEKKRKVRGGVSDGGIWMGGKKNGLGG